ncbi:MAG: urea ABC transporter permease subunit UrtC [Armatimonadetes bacterium]|nr:urea ABC transporter permease subunit UrtC [Armatimonadota bacterium]MDW8153307.1 urea ABC transporter permease subunit UrtC [Armatimonadota bacterium]
MGRLTKVVVACALLAAPWFLSGYDLALLGRFLALALPALGIVWTWGYAGVLNLGQGVFFGLGGYALAMHLKLAALSPGELPDFMVWNGVPALPWWWAPFRSPAFSLLAVLCLPTAAAAALGALLFRRRVTGVYISLITQALALAFSTLLISQQGLTGGFNGLTNFRTFLGRDVTSPEFLRILYWVTVLVVLAAVAGTRGLLRTDFGRLLLAVRDAENRVRFLGYDPTPPKVVAFALSALLAGVGGALFTLHLGVISPAMVGVVPSIEMVIWAAVGGRTNPVGAVAAAVAINLVKDRISSAFPDAWLYLAGLLFVATVLVGPVASRWWGGLRARMSSRRVEGEVVYVP